jgi:hypothetical protein
MSGSLLPQDPSPPGEKAQPQVPVHPAQPQGTAARGPRGLGVQDPLQPPMLTVPGCPAAGPSPPTWLLSGRAAGRAGAATHSPALCSPGLRPRPPHASGPTTPPAAAGARAPARRSSARPPAPLVQQARSAPGAQPAALAARGAGPQLPPTRARGQPRPGRTAATDKPRAASALKTALPGGSPKHPRVSVTRPGRISCGG